MYQMLYKLPNMEQLPKKMHCKYFYTTKCFYTCQMLNFRVISRTVAKSKLGFFVVSIDDWKSLTNVTKSLIEDVAEVPGTYLNLQKILSYI